MANEAAAVAATRTFTILFDMILALLSMLECYAVLVDNICNACTLVGGQVGTLFSVMIIKGNNRTDGLRTSNIEINDTHK